MKKSSVYCLGFIILAALLSCQGEPSTTKTTAKTIPWDFEVSSVQLSDHLSQRNWETLGFDRIDPATPGKLFLLVQINCAPPDTLAPFFLTGECLLRTDGGSPLICKGLYENDDFTPLPLPEGSYMERVREGIGKKIAESDKLYCLDSLTLVWEIPENTSKLEMSLKNSGYKPISLPQ
ncbi:MAG: hypothetical protein JW801_08210 [Bacteroidales bacterium]|nr:hypothetical protein [Bacteroidales bacterium]